MKYYSATGNGAKRLERYHARKNATETPRANAFRLIQYGHDARIQGNKEMARHWFNLHKRYRTEYEAKGVYNELV